MLWENKSVNANIYGEFRIFSVQVYNLFNKINILKINFTILETEGLRK